MEKCIEKSSRDKVDYFPREKRFQFSCSGEIARKLYYKVGYSIDRTQVRYVGITGEKDVKLETDESLILCQSFPNSRQSKVVYRDYRCFVRLSAAPKVFRVSGRYLNNLGQIRFGEHADYIRNEFEEKNAFAKISFEGKSVSVEDDLTPACIPKSQNYRRQSLSYECIVKSPGPAILVMYPRY